MTGRGGGIRNDERGREDAPSRVGLALALLLVCLTAAPRFAQYWVHQFATRLPSQSATETPPPESWATAQSAASRRCLEAIPGMVSTSTLSDKLLILYDGQPEIAYLTLSSCGVAQGGEHTIYLNGHPVSHMTPDSYPCCWCYGPVAPITYTIPTASLVVSGWNEITITSDSDLAGAWLAYAARLTVQGVLSGALKSEFVFTSSYDGSLRRAAFKIPAKYNPDVPVPLLVSIGGTGEDRWDALYHYAERTNAVGWLLLAPDVRGLYPPSGGRTASLATQHDIVDAVKLMVERFEVDTGRIYLSGFSAGGGVAATVAAKYPHLFAAVVDWIGPTDLVQWIEQRPDLYSGLVANDMGCPPTNLTGSCAFEWGRRSAREFVMNLKHVPMAIVHGRADQQVPFAQSEDFHKAMAEHYDPLANNKVAVWHDGGHFDAVPNLRPIEFLSRFVLNPIPQDIDIRTDESKDYYWIAIEQKSWMGKASPGFSRVSAAYELDSRTISLTVRDERQLDSGNLPLDVCLDLVRIGMHDERTYVVEDYNFASGNVTTRRIIPDQGRLCLSVLRDAHGSVHRRYVLYPVSSVPRPFHLPRKAESQF